MVLHHTRGGPQGPTAALTFAFGLILVLLATPHLASAQFLIMEGIEGESTDQGHEGEIDILSVSHAMDIPIDPTSGLPTGRRQHNPIVITKRIDKASPLLAQALSFNSIIASADVMYEKRDPAGTRVPELRIALQNVLVVDITQFLERDEAGALASREEVSLVYQSIRWIHEPTGTEHEDTWTGSGTSDFEIERAPVPTPYELSDVFPNPTGSSFTAFLSIAETQAVVADVYDVAGRQVSRLFEGILPSNARTRLYAADLLPAGVYFVAVRGESFTGIRKFIVIP